MSKYLAPIHSWLYNKIQLSETLENRIIATFKLYDKPEDQEFVDELFKQMGSQTGDAPIEDIIDPSNIHGWLQHKIHATEQRMAALITYVVDRSPAGYSQLHSLYSTFGLSLAESYGLSGTLTPEMAFKRIHDFLLEGMPCDRVHQVVHQSDVYIQWDATQCLHKPYFDKAKGDVSHYYTLKETMINAALSLTVPLLKYSIQKGDGQTLYTHIIKQL